MWTGSKLIQMGRRTRVPKTNQHLSLLPDWTAMTNHLLCLSCLSGVLSCHVLLLTGISSQQPKKQLTYLLRKLQLKKKATTKKIRSFTDISTSTIQPLFSLKTQTNILSTYGNYQKKKAKLWVAETSHYNSVIQGTLSLCIVFPPERTYAGHSSHVLKESAVQQKVSRS